MIRTINTIVLLTILILQISCSVSGYETLNTEPFLQLEEQYSVYLDATWTTKHADALLKVFKSISPDLNLRFSTWNISDTDLENGIAIKSKDGLKSVTISKNIFPVEESQETLSPDKFLYHAVVQFITENGTNRAVIKSILQERYGISVVVPLSTSSTAGAAKGEAKSHSDFENRDLMLIISTLEEFPKVLHRTPQLQYIVCRNDYNDKDNRGISTAHIGRGYIEFAASTFSRPNFRDTRRVIAHEKSHFLWAYVFNYQIKKEWAKLGGWYQDPNSESGWSTTQARSAFVSNYAYEMNPNEDMAESIGYYLIYPDRLRSCCPAKYEFIHDRIMLVYGKRYATSNLM